MFEIIAIFFWYFQMSFLKSFISNDDQLPGNADDEILAEIEQGKNIKDNVFALYQSLTVNDDLWKQLNQPLIDALLQAIRDYPKDDSLLDNILLILYTCVKNENVLDCVVKAGYLTETDGALATIFKCFESRNKAVKQKTLGIIMKLTKSKCTQVQKVINEDPNVQGIFFNLIHEDNEQFITNFIHLIADLAKDDNNLQSLFAFQFFEPLVNLIRRNVNVSESLQSLFAILNNCETSQKLFVSLDYLGSLIEPINRKN